MKNIIKTIFVLILLANVSCDSEPDNLMSDAKEGGAIVKVLLPKVGKALGAPQDPLDLDNTTVNFSEVELDITIGALFGGQDVTKYELVKSLKGGAEVVVASSITLPLSLQYTSIAEFLNGTEISDSNELRIGDTFSFRTKMYTNDGVYYAKDGTVDVVVNCASDLAGTYTTSYTSGIKPHYITRLDDGLYQIHSMFGWPNNTYAVTFTDTCSSVEIIDDWQYSNPIGGAGTVDPDTGNITFEGTFVDGVYSGVTWVLIKQ